MNLSFIMANNTCRSILTSVCLNYINTTEEKQAQVYTHRESEHHRESIYMFNVCLQKGIMSDQRRYGNKLWEGGSLHPPGPDTLRLNKVRKRLTLSDIHQDCKENTKAQFLFPSSGQIQHRSHSSTKAEGSYTGSSQLPGKASNGGSHTGGLVGGQQGGTPPC